MTQSPSSYSYGPLSGQYYRYDIVTLVLLMTVAMLLVLWSLGQGVVTLSPAQVWRQLFASDDAIARLVIVELRMPRILLAMLAGAALAVAGLLLQSLTRVSLASPSLLGTVDGAGLAAAVYLWLVSSATVPMLSGSWGLPLAALTGALLALLALAVLVGGSSSVLKLVLMGVALSGLFKAGITLAMIKGPSFVTSQIQLWLIGSVGHANWQDIAIITPAIAVLLLLTLLMGRRLKMAELGPESLASMGLRPRTLQLQLALLAAMLTAAAVSFVGGIAFVGLVVPHLARRYVRSKGVFLVLHVAILGGVMVLLADLAGRVLFSPYEIATGVFTAIVGIPFFIYLFLFKARS